MKKRLFFMSALAVFALAGCSNSSATTTTSTTQTTSNEDAKLKEENDTLKAEIASLNESKKTLEDENKTLKTDKTNLETEKANLEKENEYLKLNKENKYNYLKSNNSFEVTYVDFLGYPTTKVYPINDSTNIKKIITDDFNANITFNYASYINSMNGSFVDSNWSIMIYENYETASTGIDGLQVDAGDVFEFKHECWNTVESGWGSLDKYDVLVDKAIYNFAQNRLKNTLNETTTWSGSTYWEDMALYKMINTKNNNGGALFDATLFNTSLLNTELKNAIATQNVDELSGTDLFKFYYAARLTDYDFTNFKLKYDIYIKSFTEYGAWGEYTIPFVTSTAKTLGLIDSLSNDIKTSTYRADSTQFGPDGLAWQLTGMTSVAAVSDADLAEISFDKLENSSNKDVSLSTMILPFAANKKSVRQVKNANNIDVIQYLFDNYFDQATMEFATEKAAEDYSSNQIYAALVAYKIQRDTTKACNLFE